MDGFTNHGLDESAFEPSNSSISVRAFDAFPKTKPSYQTKTHSGGVWTVALIFLSCILSLSELRRWWAGHTSHAFTVEKGVSHNLQINLDIVMAMKCDDVRINIQDAAGDRILAGESLTRVATTWTQYAGKGHLLGSTSQQRNKISGQKIYAEDDVHDYLGAGTSRKVFPSTPRVPKGVTADSCRIFGTLQSNKVQGDFHITARGHGYMEFGEHLDHNSFNFSHQINELSFGPFYPNLENPLDNTFTTTDEHFYKYQYYVSIVPTIYTTNAERLDAVTKELHVSPASGDEEVDQLQKKRLLGGLMGRGSVFTNQYAVTEQSHAVPEFTVPGVFVKYDIEPILLTIAEEWDGWLAMLVRLVNVISGILVAGGWCYQVSEWGKETWLNKSKQRLQGMLHGVTSPMKGGKMNTF